MRDEQDILARAMGHVDDRMILSARRPYKKVRRWIPVAVAACLAVMVWQVYPYLRQVINTDLTLSSPEDGTLPEGGYEAGVLPNRPDEEDIFGQNIPKELGPSTITVTNVTEDTVTLKIVKTDSTPIYAAFYNKLGYPLYSTEEGYPAGSQSNLIKLTVNGADTTVYSFPAASGTYTVVVNFERVRIRPEPILEHIGFYSYIGDKGAAESIYFSLEIPEETTTGASTPID